MGLYCFDSYSKNFKASAISRNNPIEVWKDILNYSTNLHGNWMLSRHIFYAYIVPTAERNPAQFAEWIKEMVKKSGVKIKSKSEFFLAINYLSKINNSSNKDDIKKALYYLLDSGLEEPVYALHALNNTGA